jgi:hypothetical protein
VWNDTLAAGAKSWAEHLATSGTYGHDPNVLENLAACFGECGDNFKWIDIQGSQGCFQIILLNFYTIVNNGTATV